MHLRSFWAMIVQTLTLRRLVMALLAQLSYAAAVHDLHMPSLGLHARATAESTAPGSDSPCSMLFGSTAEVTLLMVADPGIFSNMSEAHYFLKHAQSVSHAPPHASLCQDVARGRLLGADVAVVTTGIGQRAAASCTASLLTLCPSRIKELVLFGTAGCSVQLGGVLNSGHCSSANPSTQVTHLGDICVSYAALDGTCRVASWQQQSAGYPDACSMPQQSVGPAREEVLGKCLFSSAPKGSRELTAELSAAAAAARGTYPRQPDLLQRYEAQYWSAMAGGTGVAYNLSAAGAQPSVYDMKECAETDSSFFFEGVPYDMQAREGVATLIRQALGVQASARDVIAFSTMEAVGLLHALHMYHAGGRRAIPYTVLRTCSDYVHSPVQRNKDGTWNEGPKPDYDMALGYRHAIATGSAAILQMLKQRCLAAGGGASCSLPAEL